MDHTDGPYSYGGCRREKKLPTLASVRLLLRLPKRSHWLLPLMLLLLMHGRGSMRLLELALMLPGPGSLVTIYTYIALDTTTTTTAAQQRKCQIRVFIFAATVFKRSAAAPPACPP
jgi:hypothetical protein